MPIGIDEWPDNLVNIQILPFFLINKPAGVTASTAAWTGAALKEGPTAHLQKQVFQLNTASSDKQRMKVALYVPSWPIGEFPNGIVTYAAFLVQALRDAGHTVFIVTSVTSCDDPHTVDLKRYMRNGIFQRMLSRALPDIARTRNMLAALDRAVSELIEIHAIDLFEMEESFGWSRAVSEKRQVPVVVRLHGPWFLNKRGIAKGDARRERDELAAILSATAVSSPSSKVLESVKRHYGIDLNKSVCIANPIECVSEADLWDIGSCDVNRILFIGRFDRIKGGDLVLKVFDELAQANPMLRLTFVGADLGIQSTDGATMLFEEYAQLTLSSSAMDRVTFLGPLHHSELNSLRKEHLMTICMSRSEVFPYSILESMSIGCPVVTTDVGGISEMIDSGESGLLVPSEDVSAMNIAIQRILNDHQFASQIGKQAWRDCQERFSSGVIAGKMISFYRNVVDDALGRYSQ